jgi:hypothetical protein
VSQRKQQHQALLTLVLADVLCDLQTIW